MIWCTRDTAAVVAFTFVWLAACFSFDIIRLSFIIIISSPHLVPHAHAFFLSLCARIQALVISLLPIEMNWILVLILGVEVRRDKRQTFCLFYFTFFCRSFVRSLFACSGVHFAFGRIYSSADTRDTGECSMFVPFCHSAAGANAYVFSSYFFPRSLPSVALAAAALFPDITFLLTVVTWQWQLCWKG